MKYVTPVKYENETKEQLYVAPFPENESHFIIRLPQTKLMPGYTRLKLMGMESPSMDDGHGNILGIAYSGTIDYENGVIYLKKSRVIISTKLEIYFRPNFEKTLKELDREKIAGWFAKPISGQRMVSGFLDPVVDMIYAQWETIDTLQASDFQKQVWKYICCIPKGQTRTYKQIALDISHPKAYRAVGSAVGKNPLAPQVPCHRVLPSDGSLGNYSGEGGTETKRKLLEQEGIKV